MYQFKLKLVTLISCYCLLSCENKTERGGNVDSTYIVSQPNVITTQCKYLELSKDFDIEVFHKRFDYENIHENDSNVVRLILSDKISHQNFDTLQLSSIYYLDNVFTDCNHVLSYSTNVNFEEVGVDNDYGDIVIADLNFDKKDDIAVINDSGGNGGVFYNYYLQESGKFVLNKYLTDSMTYFPTKIDKAKKTLTTYVHVNASHLAEHVYHLNNKTNKWIEKSHRFIPPFKNLSEFSKNTTIPEFFNQ